MNVLPYSPQLSEVADWVAPATHQVGWAATAMRNTDDPETYFWHSSRVADLSQIRTNWRASLDMIERNVPFTKRLIRTHDELYSFGLPFETLHLINSGIFKVVSLSPDGRERSADFVFAGDWLGFDGIPTGQHSCMAVALEYGEIWAVPYDSLMTAAAKNPSLLHHVLAAISAQLARNRDTALSIGTLSAEARVADFLVMWASSLAERGRRTDEINVHMSRSEIGAYLGIRLESVSRALAKLARCGVIAFNERGRRDISIPDLTALSRFVWSDKEACEC